MGGKYSIKNINSRKHTPMDLKKFRFNKEIRKHGYGNNSGQMEQDAKWGNGR